MVRPKPHRAQPTDSNRGSQRLTFTTTGTRRAPARRRANLAHVRSEKRAVGGLAPRPAREPMRQAQYSNHVQQRPLTAASKRERQHTELAGTTAKRPAAPLVRDEEARARRVPDGAVAREAPQALADNTVGTAAWLDAREPSRGGDLIRKRSQVQVLVPPPAQRP